MRDQPIARPLPTKDKTTHKAVDKHLCLELDSNPRTASKRSEPEGKRPLGKSRHRWEDNTKMGCKGVD
jgi:hypothetical protein